MHVISMNVVEVIIGKIYFQTNFGIYVTSHFGYTGMSNNGLMYITYFYLRYIIHCGPKNLTERL